ncbi:trypsin-like peptidase domain-containing protein [Nannocystis pusilla]|uniref:Trypsin-like peptidase domain-containing protein n=1 Tax=Nannocystis pusilla TaxID=889268 RepID=A0ABS7TNR8_9BACT|nr:trypsin-like peptidase domain-containing protein [Nannocystis pusilla]MBZ5709811.1 trypsin-like peptidase domain-containing protein [Nannocystis pusilla]
MSSSTIRSRRLRSPQALLAFLGLTTLGGAAVALSTNHAEAAGEVAAANSLWREGSGAPVVGGEFDPRRSLAPLVKELAPAVVNIRAYGKRQQFDAQGIDPRMLPFLEQFNMGPGMEAPPQQGIGSGFVLTADGLVVTNHHVVNGTERLEVKLHDGRMFKGKVLGSDPLTDIALVQLEGASGLKTATLGNSTSLSVGDWVMAIGSPMGLEQTATAGIVSAKGRGSLGLYANSYIDFLQTDASIAPGSSGGPLFNMAGEVVGINTAVGGVGRGLGFAVPIDQAKTVIPQLKAGGKVVRGWLGISGREIEPAVGRAPEPGAVVGAVQEGTPAAQAGLRAGDRVVAVNGREVVNFSDLRGRIADTQPGSKVILSVDRGGKKLDLDATIGKLPSEEELMRSARRMSGDRGKLFPDGQPRLGAQVEAKDGRLTVRGVAPGSLADELGLREGDVLKTINGQPVKQVGDVASALASDDGKVAVEVQRGGSTHSAMIERR